MHIMYDKYYMDIMLILALSRSFYSIQISNSVFKFNTKLLGYVRLILLQCNWEIAWILLYFFLYNLCVHRKFNFTQFSISFLKKMVVILTHLKDYKFTIYIPDLSCDGFYRQMMHVRSYMRRKKKSNIWNKTIWDLSKHLKLQMISVFCSSMKYRRHGKFLLHCRQI